ncbi:MAG: hypothetical protein A2W01_06460 [Candidatus Solincola sediminis]|uniref:Exonuclease domain-containing protein n=1 Tax=Candidatus Solincola sediminis TaxID=1797199 RepID=A0A1F2WNQ4_9ACTN|nr:MAG: hypothetical protein A2Y75_02780 [Candidatus Solincola sediminis]OFW59548.1 MAG: hypothetical protein A2W01_06460 [Candidatus Solincola sediminis]
MKREPARLIPLSEVDFCAFDVETTGLSFYSRVLEIGAVRFRHRKQPDFFNTLIKTGISIHPGAEAIHGISESMLAFAPAPEAAIPAFLDFSRNCLLIAHNARFDVSALSRELAILGLDVPGLATIDSLRLSRKFLQAENYRLATLVEHLGIPIERLHRALPDAYAVYEILERILAGNQWLAACDLEELISLCGGTLHIESPVRGRPDRTPDSVQAALLPALDGNSVVSLSYNGGSKGADLRPVRPLKIIRRHGVEYLDAYCLIDERRKLFRLDLITDIS